MQGEKRSMEKQSWSGHGLDGEYIRNRITELRKKKKISEYRMSSQLGRSKSYIQNIISGKALPSFSEFFAICDYLGVSPKDFFDTEAKNPIIVNEAIEKIRNLDENDIKLMLAVLERLKNI